MPPQLDPKLFPDQGTTAPAAQGPAGLDLSAFPDQPTTKTEPKKDTVAQSSWVERFVENFLQRGIVDPVKGMVELGKSAIQQTARTGENPINAAIDTAVKGVAGASMDRLRKAKEAFAQGRFGAAAGNVAAATPIIGPVAGEIVEQAQSGDVAGAAGGAAGVAATMLGPKLAGKVRPRVATAGDVPLTLAEKGGGKVAKFAENVVERTVPGSSVFERFRAKQQEALQQSAERVADRISKVGWAHADTGRAIQKGLEIGQAQQQALASRAYAVIDEAVKSETKRVPVVEQVPSKLVGPRGEALTVEKRSMKPVDVGGVQPSTATLRKAAVPMLRRIRQESQLIPPEQLSGVTSMLERIINSPKTLPFQAFQDARSSLLSIVRRFDDPIPGKSAGIAKVLAKETDEALMEAAEKSGIPKLPELVREANTLYRTAKETYNDTYIKKIIEASAENVPALIRGVDLDDLARLKLALPTPAFDAARARVMRDIVADATSTRGPLPRSSMEQAGLTMEGKPVNQPASTLSGRRMHTALRDMGSEKVDALFGKEASQKLVEIADLAERIGSQGPQGPTRGLIAAGVNATIFSPILRPFGVSGADFGTAAMTYGGFNLAARVLTRPEGLSMYRDFLTAVSKGNRPQALALGLRLSAMVKPPAQQPVPSHEPTAATR